MNAGRGDRGREGDEGDPANVRLLGRLAFAALVYIAAPGPLLAQHDRSQGVASGEWAVFGGAVMFGKLPEPYVSSCRADEQAVLGFGGDAGVRLGAEWDLRLLASWMREVGRELCPLNVPIRPDGIHLRRNYDVEGDGLQTVGIHAVYSPAPNPFMRVSGGAGLEWMRSVPYLAGGMNLVFGSDGFHLVGGARFLLLRTPFVAVEEEVRDGRIVNSERVGRGHEWHHGIIFRIGAEILAGGGG